MENSGYMFLTELIGRAKLLLDGMAAEQNLPLLEIVRKINGMSQVVTLLTDIAGRNKDDVRDQPPAAIPPPADPSPKMKLGKNKPDAEPVMPKPLPIKSESESESSSSEDEATPPKKARSGGKSPGSVGGSGKEFQCRHCKKILSSNCKLKEHILSKHSDNKQYAYMR
ncbi:hypothetical protein pipiens_001377 [Culex pipiens pipiens]|uniref:C2H2-type domain-containing protein n=1 Tax=Culex pipiens pipiens TaxID=38569 RepID=A0ABD1D1T5_CULPP